MKSLTVLIKEELSKPKYIHNICKDFCEEGSWNNDKITTHEVENIFDELKDYDFVKDANPTGAQKISLEKAQNLIRALVSKKNVKKAYDEWESVQSGPYWYQGYPRKEKLGYEVEMTLIIGMSKYIELNMENCLFVIIYTIIILHLFTLVINIFIDISIILPLHKTYKTL